MKIRIELEDYLKMKTTITKLETITDVIGNFRKTYDDLSTVDSELNEETGEYEDVYKDEFDRGVKQTYSRVKEDIENILYTY